MHDDEINIVGKFIPVVNEKPICVQIDDCDDFFVPLFTQEENCKNVTLKILKKLKIEEGFVIGKLKTEDVVVNMMDSGIRVMLDPILENENCTKWIEIIKTDGHFKGK